jgi:gag-polypeptide of LTR copia-type
LLKLPLLKADGSNYAFWKCHVETVFTFYDLWSVVDGSFIKPDPAVDADGTAMWKTKNESAQMYLVMAMTDELLHSVLDTKSAKVTWDRLAERYEGKGEQKVTHLIDDVFRRQFLDMEPLEPQINSLVHSARTITALELALDDCIIAHTIIRALPPSLSTLKTILSTCDNIDIEYTKSQIICNEQRRIHKSGIAATVFFTKSGLATKKGKGKGKGKDDKSKKYCTHCKIMGHDASECRKLKKEQEAKAANSAKPTTATPAAMAKIANTDEPASDETVRTVHVFCAQSHPTNLKLHQHSWIMDSDASRTMCSNRKWFQQFSNLARDIPVVLGDNSAIQGVGQGCIHVRMHAGNEWNDVILQNVLYVPELHGNLLSISHLTDRGADV